MKINNLLIAKLIHNRVNRQIESITRRTAIISTRAHIKHRRVRLTSTNRTIDRMGRREAIMSSQSGRGRKRTHSIGSHNRRVQIRRVIDLYSTAASLNHYWFDSPVCDRLNRRRSVQFDYLLVHLIHRLFDVFRRLIGGLFFLHVYLVYHFDWFRFDVGFG